MMADDVLVAFYLENKNAGDVDVSRPEQGNPGLGGTEFNFITLAFYLEKLCGFRITLLANDTRYLPGNLSCKTAGSIEAAISWCVETGVDVFVYRPRDFGNYVQALELIDNGKLRSIAWAHNTPFFTLGDIAKSQYLKRMVCVSVEQYDMLRDHRIVEKLDVILNGFDVSPYLCPEIKTKDRLVAYIGSLVPPKGFHILAQRWKGITERVPDARLQVIGTGQLHDRNARLGPLGVADSRYEKRCVVPHLCNADGELLESVNFLGLLGEEKISVMQSARVGVVNPTGKTENCPGSALEFQASGTPVVSCARWGLLDTVAHDRTGYLARDYNEFEDAIVRLLLDDNEADRLGSNGPDFVRTKFDYQKICTQWIKLFNDVAADKACSVMPISQNRSYKAKRPRELIRRLKTMFPFLWPILPSYAGIRITAKRIARLMRKGGLLQSR